MRSPRTRLISILVVLSISSTGFIMLTAAETPARIDDAGSESSISSFLQPAAGQGGGQVRIRYDTGSGPVSIQNHAVIPLADGLRAEIALDPYPPNTFDVSVDLFLTTADGEPVTESEVNVTWDMAVMWHGPFETRLNENRDGHYSATFDMFMFGPWQLDARLVIPGHDPQPLSLLIYVWPQ